MARDTAWRLVVSTVGTCFRNRVTGLAAEAAFFALLSLPPLIFGLAGSIGYVFDSFSAAQVEQVRAGLADLLAAGNAKDLRLTDGEGALTVSDVELVPQPAE